MQFESKLKRRYWFHAFLNLIPDTLIAIILAAVFKGGFLGFLGVLVGLQLLYFAIWLKDTIWSWLVFGAFGRKQLAALLQDSLAARKFPEPAEYQSSIDGYFGQIASDETESVDIRVAAAAELGALSYPASQRRLQESMRISMAYEDALVAYKRAISSGAR